MPTKAIGLPIAILLCLCSWALAQDRPAAIAPAEPIPAGAKVGGSGHRTTAGEGDAQIPVVVVRGTPYEMGWHLGRLTRDEMQRFIPAAMARLKPTLGMTDQGLRDAWARRRRTVTTVSSTSCLACPMAQDCRC
jgi:hypothetical protein